MLLYVCNANKSVSSRGGILVLLLASLIYAQLSTVAIAQTETPAQIKVRRANEATRKAEEATAQADAKRREAEEELHQLKAKLKKSDQVATPTKPLQVQVTGGRRYHQMEDVMQVAGCTECGQMASVPAGIFDMGSKEGVGEADERPVRREVQVAAFELGRTEVTQGQWQAVMGTNPSNDKNCGINCPVTNVSWTDIVGQNGFLKNSIK